MGHDDFAIDGLLRELARRPEGDDDVFLSRVLSRVRKPAPRRRPFLAAAALLVALGLPFALSSEAPTGQIDFSRPKRLVSDAAQIRVLMKDLETGRLLLLAEVPIDAPPRAPAGTPLLLQALGRDGLALWTAPSWIQVRKSPPGPGATLDKKSVRSIEFARDVKPILDQHCAGCHAEAELVHAAVKPFEARRSPLVTQTHAPLSTSERHQLALWVDLGAAGRP